jgi:hypothetical protein
LQLLNPQYPKGASHHITSHRIASHIIHRATVEYCILIMLSRISHISSRQVRSVVLRHFVAANVPNNAAPSSAPIMQNATTPPSSSNQSVPQHRQKIQGQPHGKKTQRQDPKNNTPEQESSAPLLRQFKDERLPAAQHLDPDGKELPTSEWIHVGLNHPFCAMEEIVAFFEKLLREQADEAVDLEAEWNPHQDESLPFLEIPEGSCIEAAHVVLSPYGRPNGWHLKFPNRSMAHAILMKAQSKQLYISWKPIRVKEYHYQHPTQQRGKGSRRKKRNKDGSFHSMHHDFVVDHSMVRLESCPSEVGSEYIRYMMSRFDLAPQGTTVIRWKGRTPNGKIAPPMYILRFASPAWARAAVRELQSTQINDKEIKLIQYPKQIRYSEKQTEKNSTTSTTSTSTN